MSMGVDSEVRKPKDYNNPKRIFKEKGGVELPGKKSSFGSDGLTSIRCSEVTSIVPDDVNWNKIYAGKQRAPLRPKPGTDPRR